MAQETTARTPTTTDEPGSAQDERPESEPLTVAALLAEPLLRNTLVAGSAGVHQPVRWCLPLSELSGTTDREGTVVHAPMTDLHGDTGAAKVHTVKRQGAVAILVQLESLDSAPGGELGTVIAEAREAADEAELPLAIMAPSTDYRTVSQLVATKVLAQSTHVLEYRDHVHRALGEILARGAGVRALASGMARMAKTPVLVLDLDVRLLAYESAAGTQKPQPEPLIETLADYLGRLTAQAPSATPSIEPSMLAPIGTAASTVLIASPVTFGGEITGVAAALDTVDADPHDRAQRRIITHEGAVLIGSELLRIRSITEAEERTRGDFIVDLVHGRFADSQQLQARARYHGFDVDASYIVAVAEPDPPIADQAKAVRQLNTAARAVERHLSETGLPVLTTQIGGNLVAVCPLPQRADNKTGRETANAVRELLSERLGSDARVAFGRNGIGAAGIAASYRQARTALALGRRIDAPPVAGYDDLRVFVAIGELARSENGHRFAAELLTPLRHTDGNTCTLENVVLAYIAESGNLNAAARRLQLHRNTTLYKLNRVSRALNMDIRSADTQFMIWLAHHIDILQKVDETLDAELVPPLNT
ncbi:PucR family transcriptional regulator [Sciscionella marina]|uniref:PucR family transcriptional regulator n=1 Tax=Sciscionella marina TaxID=508770 RepID=UPI000361D433|nr:helix-turn-helix domain-containing protein [Sciscionella marina]